MGYFATSLSEISGRQAKQAYPLAASRTPGLRVIHPDTGRWLSPDPIGERGGINLYGFVGNEPVGKVDMLGLEGVNTVSLTCCNMSVVKAIGTGYAFPTGDEMEVWYAREKEFQLPITRSGATAGTTLAIPTWHPKSEFLLESIANNKCRVKYACHQQCQRECDGKRVGEPWSVTWADDWVEGFVIVRGPGKYECNVDTAAKDAGCVKTGGDGQCQ